MKIGELVDRVDDAAAIEIHDKRIHRRERETYGKPMPAYEREVVVYQEGNVSTNGRLGELIMVPGDTDLEDEISAFAEEPNTPYRLARPIFDALANE